MLVYIRCQQRGGGGPNLFSKSLSWSHTGWSKNWNCVFVEIKKSSNSFQCQEPGVSGNSRSRSFPRMEASDSLSRTLGMDFFIPFPFPNFGNGIFYSLPIPEIWEWIFLFLSRSRISGMCFFNSLPYIQLVRANFFLDKSTLGSVDRCAFGNAVKYASSSIHHFIFVLILIEKL